jgi:hypothetical protein
MADLKAPNQTIEIRVQDAVSDFRKNNPGVKLEQYQLDGLLEAAKDYESSNPGKKLTPAQIQTVLVKDLQEKDLTTKKITGNIGEVVTGSMYGLDGVANQSIGRAAQAGNLLAGGAVQSGLRLAGPVIGVGIGTYDTVSALREGDKVKAGAAAGGAIGSIATATAAGALMGSFVPGAGTLVGAGVGFVAGIGGYYLGRWTGGMLAQSFGAAANPPEKAAAPQPLLRPLAPGLTLNLN